MSSGDRRSYRFREKSETLRAGDLGTSSTKILGRFAIRSRFATLAGEREDFGLLALEGLRIGEELVTF